MRSILEIIEDYFVRGGFVLTRGGRCLSPQEGLREPEARHPIVGGVEHFYKGSDGLFRKEKEMKEIKGVIPPEPPDIAPGGADIGPDAVRVFSVSTGGYLGDYFMVRDEAGLLVSAHPTLQSAEIMWEFPGQAPSEDGSVMGPFNPGFYDLNLSSLLEPSLIDSSTPTERIVDGIVERLGAGKVKQDDRARVRKALDQADGPPTGRAKSDQALGRAIK